MLMLRNSLIQNTKTQTRKELGNLETTNITGETQRSINMEAKLTSTGDADTRHKDKTRRQKGRDIIIYFLKLTKTEVRLKGKMHSHSFQCY